jgi:hypothetical protein
MTVQNASHRVKTGKSIEVSMLSRLLRSVLIAVLMSPAAHAQDILLLRGNQTHAAEEHQLRGVADFLGLHLRVVDLASSGQGGEIAIANPAHVSAIVISADALDLAAPVERALNRVPRHVPRFIFDIDTDSDATQLARWSGGTVTGCDKLSPIPNPTVLHMARQSGMLGALAGVDLPAVDAPSCHITTAYGRRIEPVLTLSSHGADDPVLLMMQRQGSEIFFAPHMLRYERTWMGKPDSLASAFSSMAPWILFLKHAAGPFAWHLERHYANFTVDDPRLVEPYGNMSYQTLLREMETHHFHTTIAFIPWNYNRNDAQAIDIVRRHPAQFSICVHGNNHAHREFGEYAIHPLGRQIEDVKQAVARMEEFHRSTGISYDRVMVFPHGVPPKPTFDALKVYGFLGTANSLNVPLDETFPTNPLFLLRPYTTNYAGILSLSRLSVEAPISEVDLAILSFLNDPILLYGHQGAFRDGAGHLLSAVDAVNRIAPGTEWVSLGTLARHLYEMRQVTATRFEVKPLAKEVSVRNSLLVTAEFDVIAKPQPGGERISEILCDGHPVNIQRRSSGDTVVLRLAPGQERLISLHYSDEATITKVDLGTPEPSVYLLRHISEIRDQWISVNRWGQAAIDGYYRGKGESLELRFERNWMVAVAAMASVAAMFCCLLLRSIYQRRKITSAPWGRASS